MKNCHCYSDGVLCACVCVGGGGSLGEKGAPTYNIEYQSELMQGIPMKEISKQNMFFLYKTVLDIHLKCTLSCKSVTVDARNYEERIL